MISFSYPNYLEPSIISELENSVIEICNTCKNYLDISRESAPLWQWAGTLLKKTPEELRHEIETHEADEHFLDAYNEERDHLLKLPILLLEHINNK